MVLVSERVAIIVLGCTLPPCTGAAFGLEPSPKLHNRHQGVRGGGASEAMPLPTALSTLVACRRVGEPPVFGVGALGLLEFHNRRIRILPEAAFYVQP